ncbi:MAG: DUF1911 domain-containing protein [Lachnospiraceae bacterium]|nr:DUF1911 domain-containing protein [Lachnospiraceae bacterium]
MRDSLANKEKLTQMIRLYSNEIKSSLEDIEQMREDIKDGIQRYPEKPEQIIINCQSDLCRDSRRVFNATYTIGEKLEIVEERYREACKYALSVDYNSLGYVNMLHYITAGILFEISKGEMQKLVDLIDEAEVDDLLFDFFVEAYGLKRKCKSSNYHEEKPYYRVMEIVDMAKKDTNTASKMLKDYVEKEWLKGHADYGWMTFHKEPGYCGLWSYESAALAKILQIDDEELIEDNHYPYDLAHYKKGKIYNPSVSIHNKDGKANNSYPDHIVDNPLIENVIPQTFYSCVNQLVEDYYGLQDEEFWLKYNLKNVWFELDDYIEEKKSGLLGMLIVFSLTEAGYITQLDYKEEIDDYRESIKNYWDIEDTQIIEFILNNDQVYLARIPSDHNLCALYEVEVRKLRQEKAELEKENDL